MDTNGLIATLVRELRPVRRLLPPRWRLAGWLALALPASAAVVVAMGPRPDLAVRLADPVFLAQELAMLATALVAGWAALSACVPGCPRWVLWAPAVPAAAWAATLGRQCWLERGELDFGALASGPDAGCIFGVAVIGAIPALAMLVLVRRAVRLDNSAVVVWGALAAAALANAGLRLFHAHDAALLVIVWQLGSVLALTALAALVKDRLVPEFGLSA